MRKAPDMGIGYIRHGFFLAVGGTPLVRLEPFLLRSKKA